MRIIIQLHLILLLILASSSAQLSFSQRLGGSMSFKSNELGPAFFIQDNDSISRYHFQVDFLTFTVVHRDQYNNDARVRNEKAKDQRVAGKLNAFARNE